MYLDRWVTKGSGEGETLLVSEGISRNEVLFLVVTVPYTNHNLCVTVLHYFSGSFLLLFPQDTEETEDSLPNLYHILKKNK